MQQVYEAVWGVRLDPRNFYRKVQGTPGLAGTRFEVGRIDGSNYPAAGHAALIVAGFGGDGA